MKKIISICVATRNRPDMFKRMCESVLSLADNPNEIEFLICRDKDDKIQAQPFYNNEPVVYLMHDLTADEAAQQHKKAIWPVRTYDILVWGRAEDKLKKFI